MDKNNNSIELNWLTSFIDSNELFNKNCPINTDQLGILLDLLGQNLTEKDLKVMIKDFSADRETVSDFHEFLAIMARKLNNSFSEDKLKEAFKVFDKNDKNYINNADLKQIMTMLGEKLTDEEVNEMIKEADFDGDDQVNYQDFAHMMTSK